MAQQRKRYDDLLKLDFGSVPAQDALTHLGNLIDLAADRGDEQGLRHAIAVSEPLLSRLAQPPHQTTFHYYVANAWAGLRHVLRQAAELRWDWEQPEAEHEIFHLRLAVQAGRRGDVPDRRHLCPMLTNLGNLMNFVGRFVEAIAYWDEALSTDPTFGMARGNRGFALSYYARHHYDESQAALFLRCSLLELRDALNRPLTHDARRGFDAVRQQLERILKPEFVTAPGEMDQVAHQAKNPEVDYRRWCLRERLFLNPLNDLGQSWSAARDSLTLPGIVVPIKEGPKHQSFFNQMKQEFASARYLYYDAMTSQDVHFSDRDVLLLNTLDYPSYSLATEKLKCAFRMAYSLLDKVAYFLNDYLALQIPERRVTFRSLWYEQQDRRQPLRADLRRRENWPLRGLFWLSKDLGENKAGFQESLEPEMKDLADVRNHLEHKHLKLHDDFWPGPDEKLMSFRIDSLARSMRRSEFAAKTLQLLRVVRAGLVHLSLAVHREETVRNAARGPDELIPDNPMDIWEDEWKR